jgi:hypothetical protein
MKLSRLFLAALIAGLFVSPSAHAVTASYYDVEAYNKNHLYGFEHDYLVDGVLENNKQILITYTATNVSPAFLLAQGNVAPGSLNLTALRTNLGSWFPLSTSYVFTETNSLNHTGTLTDTILIKNVSGFSETFAAYFLSIIKQVGCGSVVGVTAEISSVPLPPAFLLFASGLVALGGFAARKKANGSV